MRTWKPALCLSFLGAVAPAQSLASGTLWLQIETRVNLTFACQDEESETLIFRDGLVTRKSVSEDGLIIFTRMAAPSEPLRRLADALAANRVGVAAGSCALDAVQPNAFFESAVTWFGKAGRVHTIAVAAPGAAAACPASTEAIFTAIDEFIGAASVAAGGTRAELPFDPGPPCGD